MSLDSKVATPRWTTTERRAVAIAVALMALLSFWLASDRTLDPGYAQQGSTAAFPSDFYRQQAVAMLDGRLNVPFADYSFTECFFRDGECYGYFGLTPSIIRLAGFALTASTETNPSPVVIAMGTSAGLWAVLYLALSIADSMSPSARLRPRSRLWLIVLVAALLGPGGLFTFLSQAKVYYEAIVLMAAGLLVCFAFVFRWLIARRTSHLVVALAAGVLAANARPTAIIATSVLGIGIIVIAARDPRSPERWGELLGASLLVVPAATALGVMWLKFRALNPSYTTYAYYESPIMQRLLALNNGSLQGPRYIANHLVNLLRPDSLAFDSTWPWVQHAVPEYTSPIVVPPIVPQGLYVEFAASLTNTMPVALVLTVAFAVLVVLGVVRFAPGQQLAYALLTVAAATVPLGALTIYALTTRYLGDFLPLLAVGTSFALVWLVGYLERRPRAFTLITAGLLVSAVITFVVNLGLNEQMFTIIG